MKKILFILFAVAAVNQMNASIWDEAKKAAQGAEQAVERTVDYAKRTPIDQQAKDVGRYATGQKTETQPESVEETVEQVYGR